MTDAPLLGLHNRDYASLWAASRLARYSESELLTVDRYLDRVTAAAWYFGRQLQALEARDRVGKLAVLFPTNTGKRPSAERGFQTFAVGGVGRHRDEAGVAASGPLFAWRVIDVEDDGMLVGLTGSGAALLRGLDGLSLALPHSQAHMERFLEHLADHAPADRWGFDHLLAVVADGPDRATLVSSFAESSPDWTDATASSVAQGYVARSREWGLVEPKLVEGRYWLTDRGRVFLRDQT